MKKLTNLEASLMGWSLYEQSQKCCLTMDKVPLYQTEQRPKSFDSPNVASVVHATNCTKVVIQIPTRPMRYFLAVARFNYEVFQDPQRRPKWRNAHQRRYRLRSMKSVAVTYPSVPITIATSSAAVSGTHLTGVIQESIRATLLPGNVTFQKNALKP